jgi:hypothetical protein
MLQTLKQGIRNKKKILLIARNVKKIMSKEKNTNTQLGKHVCTKGQAKKDRLLPSTNTSMKTK